MMQQMTVQPDPPIVIPPPTQPRYAATIGEILAFAAELEGAGYNPGDKVEAAHELLSAIDEVAGQGSVVHHYDDGLLHRTPAEVGHALRTAGVEVASQSATAAVAREFIDQLALDIAAAIRDASDDIIERMRPEFDAALAVVQAAAAAGITTTTNADEIVSTGNTKAVSAFRRLPEAVRVLDRIGELRDNLTQLCAVGPHDYPAAAWLAEGATMLDVEGAHNLRDLTELVPVRTATHASFARVVVQRTGGRWLALLAAGYRVRLNTGPEADAVLAAAQAEDAA